MPKLCARRGTWNLHIFLEVPKDEKRLNNFNTLSNAKKIYWYHLAKLCVFTLEYAVVRVFEQYDALEAYFCELCEKPNYCEWHYFVWSRRSFSQFYLKFMSYALTGLTSLTLCSSPKYLSFILIERKKLLLAKSWRWDKSNRRIALGMLWKLITTCQSLKFILVFSFLIILIYIFEN